MKGCLFLSWMYRMWTVICLNWDKIAELILNDPICLLLIQHLSLLRLGLDLPPIHFPPSSPNLKPLSHLIYRHRNILERSDIPPQLHWTYQKWFKKLPRYFGFWEILNTMLFLFYHERWPGPEKVRSWPGATCRLSLCTRTWWQGFAILLTIKVVGESIKAVQSKMYFMWDGYVIRLIWDFKSKVVILASIWLQAMAIYTCSRD